MTHYFFHAVLFVVIVLVGYFTYQNNKRLTDIESLINAAMAAQPAVQ